MEWPIENPVRTDGGDGLDELADAIKERQRHGRPASAPTDVDVESPPQPVEELLDEPDSPAPAYDSDALDEIGDGDSVLVLGPLNGTACDSLCTDLLLGRQGVEHTLYITLTHTLENRVGLLDSYAETTPESVGVIRIGGEDSGHERSTIATNSAHQPSELEQFYVADASDLPRLGITITRYLNELAERREGIGVCFHSISTLLQYVDEQRLFRFLHLLKAKTDERTTTQHYHMDPRAHDQRTVTIYRNLFDTTVELTKDGTLTIST